MRVPAARLFAVLAATLLLAAGVVRAEDERTPFVIGYLDLEEDLRHEVWGRHPIDIRSGRDETTLRPLVGAEMGILDIRPFERRTGLSFVLAAERVGDGRSMLAALERLRSETGIFLIDAPSAMVAELARATAGQGVLLINVSAIGDELRNDQCQLHLFHTMPSRRMLSDALAQYLIDRGWRDVLVLQGPLQEDAASVAAFRGAARSGLDVTEVRDFLLSSDPRLRDLSSLDTLTAQADYDVVYVADTDREFARSVPNATRAPAVVAGDAGLVPEAWHWSYPRHGAPQVQGRFERRVDRRMGSRDWAAWVAVRAIGEAVVRSGATDAEGVFRYFREDEFRLDGSKGPGLTFRRWNGQLRQPILLTSGDWVTAVAPISEFVHRTDNLDTLGVDERASTCDPEEKMFLR